MSYEDRILGSIDRSRTPDTHPIIVRAHEKALRTLKDGTVSPEHFLELYGADNISADLALVEKLKSRFEKNETQKTAEIFEAVFFEQAELSEWLGPNAETVKTSEYDDYINGIDLISEFTEEGTSPNYLALGVDVTFGSQVIGKKFDRVITDIENDTLSTIKYFETDHFKGILKNVPRVIVGIEDTRVRELAYLWTEGEKRALGEHPVRDIVLHEISNQLQTFSEVARKLQKDRAARAFTGALQTIENIRKTMQPRRLGDMADDRVYKNINAELEYMKKHFRL